MGKFRHSILSIIAVFATYIAMVSADRCFPFSIYQPKVPKSLIKSE
ncbi:cyclic lactone autoinducer peptide [Acetivibrio cellulolyticus]|nr:cyclic lactone autoinducer peptide [Acetivibrio cellulolyticus]